MSHHTFMLPALFIFTTLFINCNEDDDGGSFTPTPIIDIETLVDAQGNWNDEAIAIFESKIEGTTSTGADDRDFTWTVAEEGTTFPDDTEPPSPTQILEGFITSNRTLDENEVYELRGRVIVNTGVTLTIPPGTLILADSSNNSVIDNDTVSLTIADALIVLQGGKLNAAGTASDPILFTSLQDEAGSWGGIVIAGNAPINQRQGELVIDENSTLSYGGNEDEDNSGALEYVILINSGAKINETLSYSAFAFYGIGSGTSLLNLEVVNAKENGFEWIGGTVDAKNLIAQAAKNSFDWKEGYVGTINNIIANQPSNAAYGIEGNNLENDTSATPVSKPTIMNATLNTSGTVEAIKLATGTSAYFSNILISIEGTSVANFKISELDTALNIQNGITTFINIQLDSDNSSFTGNIPLN